MIGIKILTTEVKECQDLDTIRRSLISVFMVAQNNSKQLKVKVFYCIQNLIIRNINPKIKRLDFPELK